MFPTSSPAHFVFLTRRDRRIFKKTRGAGDEIGMFPKEESHVRVMIFFLFLNDICIEIIFQGRPKLFVGLNFSSAQIFVGPNFSSALIFVTPRKFRHLGPTLFGPIRYSKSDLKYHLYNLNIEFCDGPYLPQWILFSLCTLNEALFCCSKKCLLNRSQLRPRNFVSLQTVIFELFIVTNCFEVNFPRLK